MKLTVSLNTPVLKYTSNTEMLEIVTATIRPMNNDAIVGSGHITDKMFCETIHDITRRHISPTYSR